MRDSKTGDERRVLLLVVCRGQGGAIIPGLAQRFRVQADGRHVQTKHDISVQFQEGNVVIMFSCQRQFLLRNNGHDANIVEVLFYLRPAVTLVPHSDADVDHAAGPRLLKVDLGGEAGVAFGADAVGRCQHEP